MIHNIVIKYKNLMLRQIKKDDIEQLRQWRNDKEKTKFLRRIGNITPEMQIKWYEKYLNNPDEMAFAICEVENLNCLIGSVSLYNFNQNQVEIGKILIGEDKVKGLGFGRLSFAMLMTYAFTKLQVVKPQKIVATVNKHNIPARTSYFRLGFKVVGETYTENAGLEDVIEIDKETFLKINNYYKDIKIEHEK